MSKNIETNPVDLLVELVNKIKSRDYYTDPSELPLLIEQINQTDSPVGFTPELLDDVVKFLHPGQPETVKIETLDLFLEKAGDVKPNYEKLLHDENIMWDPEKTKLLVTRADEVSVETAQDILGLKSKYFRDKDYDAIEEIIKKAPAFDLTPFVEKFYNAKILALFLGGIDEITESTTAQHLLRCAVSRDDDELLAQTEAKSQSVTFDYSSVLNRAISNIGQTVNYSNGPTITHDGNVRILTHLLEKGADANFKGKDYSNNHELHPLEQIMYLRNKNQDTSEVIDTLLKFGSKISLLENTHTQTSIINSLQKRSQYQQLEDYLDDCEGEKEELAINQVLKCAFQADDPKLLEILGIDLNQNFNLSYFGYSSYEEDSPQALIVQACQCNKTKIATSLAQSKSEVGEYPIVAHAVQLKNNQLLQVLCENGYDLNATFPKTGKENDFYIGIHPLEMAIRDGNLEACQLLIKHLKPDDLTRLDRPLERLIYCHDSKGISIEEGEKLILNLMKKGLEAPEESKKHLLLSACKKGMINVVKYCAENGFDLNEKSDLYKKGDNLTSPIKEAISTKNNELTKYLLQRSVTIDEGLALKAISQEIQNDLITEIIDRSPDINHHNFSKENALHMAAQKGNKEVFDFLITQNIDVLHCDNKGSDAYYHALYYGNTEKLGIPDSHFPFPLDVFNEIFKYVVKQKELEHYSVTEKGEYAAKLSCLFNNKEQTQAYLEKYNTGEQKFHDLTIFTFPKGQWNREAWGDLAMENGLKLTKYLFLAEKIEEKLGRAPENMEEILFLAKSIKYHRAAENPEMADLFHENVIPEHAFNRTLRIYKEKTEDHIPDIQIEGSQFGHDRFYMKKLAPNDLRGFILGNKTNCCQYVGAEGSDCAEHGMNSPFGGFYVMFKREKAGRCENLENWIKNLEEAKTAQDFLKGFQDKAAKKKYVGIIEDIAKELKEENDEKPEFNEIKQVLKRNFEKELEGEIVAQSWVWISENNNLVMDSWERLRKEDDNLFKPFIKKLSEQILTNENNNFSRIMIGSGGYTPYEGGLKEVKDPESPQDYKLYRDSKDQYLLASRSQDTVKTNPALSITDARVQKLEEHFNKDKYDEKYQPVTNKNFEALTKVQESWRDRHKNEDLSNNDSSRST